VRLTISAFGRPAPQGSHELGRAGQLLDSSPYLRAWRVKIRHACFREYARLGVPGTALPLFPADVPVIVERCTFYVRDDQCRAAGTDHPTGTPDIDKLLRGVLDALGGAPKSARVFADDSQVVEVRNLNKVRMTAGKSGAFIIISDGRD
jgi:crossover junction endodeoxyribonuclease RusA